MEWQAIGISNVPGKHARKRHTLSGKLIVFELLGGPSFLDRGVPSPAPPVRRKPTRFAADFIHALLLSTLLDFVEVTGVMLVVVADCKEEEKVGVMKCGDLDLAEFSFSADFLIDFGESRDWYPIEEFDWRFIVLPARAVMSVKVPMLFG